MALWVAKQYCGFPFVAGPALTADGPPVEDDEVAGSHLADSGADGFDDAGGFVAEQERVVVVDAALAIVQVRMADPTGLDGDDRLAGTGIRDHDVDDLDGLTLGAGDDALDGLWHDGSLGRGGGGCSAPTLSSPGGRRTMDPASGGPPAAHQRNWLDPHATSGAKVFP